MEEVVTFRTRKGQTLFGVAHVPEEKRSSDWRIGINLLNPGVKYRVAPNRLYVKLARRLCQEGFYVLRFDPAGIGDSEGELPESVSMFEIWARIQSGLFVADTIDANDFFIKQYGIQSLALMGSCGGAITSLLASRVGARVESLCLIDVPVFLGSASMSFSDLAVEGGIRAEYLFSEYFKKTLSPKNWYRFLTLKSDYKAVWRIVGMKVREKMPRFRARAKLAESIEEMCERRNLNRLFFQSLQVFLEKKRPILFILAEHDHGTDLFQHAVEMACLNHGEGKRAFENLVQISVIENANHVYTLTESQEKLAAKVSEWALGLSVARTRAQSFQEVSLDPDQAADFPKRS